MKVYYGYNNGWSAGQSGMNICNLTESGSIDANSCISANLSVNAFGSVFYPWYLDYEVIDGVKYMYISDWGNGGLFRCEINSDGTLANCVNTIDANNSFYPHLQYAFNTIGNNVSLFLPADTYYSGAQYRNALVTFDVTQNGTVMTPESEIAGESLRYFANGIQSATVAP